MKYKHWSTTLWYKLCIIFYASKIWCDNRCMLFWSFPLVKQNISLLPFNIFPHNPPNLSIRTFKPHITLPNKAIIMSIMNSSSLMYNNPIQLIHSSLNPLNLLFIFLYETNLSKIYLGSEWKMGRVFGKTRSETFYWYY